MPPYAMDDVVVLLPGITGSVLKKDGAVVWGYSAGSIAKALFTSGGSMARALALPHDDPDVDDLGDGIVADAPMPDLHLLPGVWKIDAYGAIVEAITATFAVTEGKNFFQFPYDWRRDNRVASRKLASAARGWLKTWRESSGNRGAKLILVAHSMGGLVSRHFLEVPGGMGGYPRAGHVRHALSRFAQRAGRPLERPEEGAAGPLDAGAPAYGPVPAPAGLRMLRRR